MDNSNYDEMEGIRRSDLWLMNQTPAHFRYLTKNRPEQTKAMAFGSAVHKLILEPDTFNDEYYIMCDFDRRTKAGKEAYTDALFKAEGRKILDIADFEKAGAMKLALSQHPGVSELLNGVKEQPLVWEDSETGELCKIKPDCVTRLGGRNYIVDYKTTTSCADGAFERSCRKYGYDFQAGMYTEGMEVTKLERYHFVFIAQESAPPYACRIYWCDDGFVNAGKRKFHTLLRKYHQCKELDKWEGYTDEDLYEESYD